jgi:hypothetical protein
MGIESSGSVGSHIHVSGKSGNLDPVLRVAPVRVPLQISDQTTGCDERIHVMVFQNTALFRINLSRQYASIAAKPLKQATLMIDDHPTRGLEGPGCLGFQFCFAHTHSIAVMYSTAPSYTEPLIAGKAAHSIPPAWAA